MNKEKIDEVGSITATTTSNLKTNALKRSLSLAGYYILQFIFLVASGLAGLVLGTLSRSYNAYPNSSLPLKDLYGSLYLTVFHGSNIGLSFLLIRKKRLIYSKKDPSPVLPVFVYPVIFINIILSILSSFIIHNFVANYPHSLSATSRYGVFLKKENQQAFGSK